MSNYATEDCAEITVHEMRGVINDAKCNGFDEAVFAGRNQVRQIIDWAYDAGYLAAPVNLRSQYGRDLIEGDHRPEIEGLPVYMVNADNYFRVS